MIEIKSSNKFVIPTIFFIYIVLTLFILLLNSKETNAAMGYYCSETNESGTNICSGQSSWCECSDGYYRVHCNTFYYSINCVAPTADCLGYAYQCYTNYTTNYTYTSSWCGGTCGSCSLSCSAGYVLNGTDYGCGSYGVSCTKYYSNCSSLSCGTNSGTCRKDRRLVTVDANSGTCSTDDHYVCWGTTSIAPSCSRTGYTRTGYSLTGTCSGTWTASTGVCSNVQNAITVDALWQINTYSISFTRNNTAAGSLSKYTDTINYGSALTGPTVTTNSGYTFQNFTITSGSCAGTFNSATGACSNVQADMTIQANWGVNLTYTRNPTEGGSLSFYSQVANYGGSATGPTVSTNTGYVFVSFSITSGSCAGTFTASTGTCSNVQVPITIQATWEVDNDPPTVATSLQTNGLTNPTNVTTPNPVFSAIFNDPNTGDTGNWYEVEVNTASDFTGTVMWDSGVQSMTATAIGAESSDITYAGSALGWSGTTYYWRIRFGDDSAAMCLTWASAQFTMHTNSNPTAPTDLKTEGATNPTQVIDTTPEFTAVYNDADTGDTAVKYEIEVNTNNTFSGTVMWDSGLVSMSALAIGSTSTAVSYNGTTLSLNGAKYYWRIRFVDNYDGIGAWPATAGEFTMNNTPTATDLKTNGSTNPSKVYVVSAPNFTAYFSDGDSGATATHYEIDVNTDINFGGTVMWDSPQTVISPALANNSTSSNIPYNGTALTANGQIYYWRIRFWDNTGTPSLWSSTANFRTTVAPSAPTALLVDGQTNPASINSLTPTFSAIHNDLNTDSATAYEIEVNSNNTFTGTVMWDTGKLSTSVTNGSRSPNYTYSGTALTGSSSTVYYWRIRFWDVDDNQGDWSAVNSFTDTMSHMYVSGLGVSGVRFD